MKRISKLISLLEKAYGTPRFTAYDAPLNELVVTILSQNTTWQNCQRAFDNLKANFKNWREVMSADIREIKRAIQCGGLGNIKARRIKHILKEIYSKKGSLNLNFLARMKNDEAIKFLRSFKGIGPKTASCVLMFSFKRPVLPVDTHILRVSKRLGLIDNHTDLVEAHRLLGEIVPKNRVLSFHINMIQHGRNTCRPKRPKCASCVIKPFCDNI